MVRKKSSVRSRIFRRAAFSILVAFSAPGESFGSTLWGTGSNRYGQLGVGSTEDQNPPTRLIDDVNRVISTNEHTLFITTNGELWGTGNNAYGQLGNGTNEDVWVPILIDTNVLQAVSGDYHTIYLKSDGSMWTMGRNFHGQLGDGTQTNRNSPLLISNGVAFVAAGEDHSLFVMDDGTLMGMGNGGSGQLGSGGGFPTSNPVNIATNVSQAAGGWRHSLFLKTDGSLWAMGSNHSGQVGDASFVDTTEPVMIAENVSQITAAASHSLFIGTNGYLWGFGSAASGQLGLGDVTRVPTPRLITTGVVDVTAGKRFNTYVTEDGSLWGMGAAPVGVFSESRVAYSPPKWITGGVSSAASGNYHALWTKDEGSNAHLEPASLRISHLGGRYSIRIHAQGKWNPSKNVPWINFTQIVQAEAGRLIVEVEPNPSKQDRAAQIVVNGARHTLTQAAAGDPFPELLAVGSNADAQLGIGRDVDANEPVKVASNIVAVETSYDHGYHLSGQPGVTLFLDEAGDLWGTGEASAGQLGINPDQGAMTPDFHQVDRVKVAAGVISFSTGRTHTAYVKTDGSLWTLGRNNEGQLGDGTNDSRAGAVQIAANVVEVSCSGSSTFYITASGELWATGKNNGTWLGDGTEIDRTTPVKIAENVARVFAKESHVLFIDTSHQLWGIGGSGGGVFGLGEDTAVWLEPQKIVENIKSAAVARNHSLWVNTSGELWGTGNATSGQLGSRNPYYLYEPVLIATGVVDCFAGLSHSLYITSDQQLWAMGDGFSEPTLLDNDVVAADAGSTRIDYVKSDGSLWTYGENLLHGLGRYATPVIVATGVEGFAVAKDYGFFHREDGILWASGYNNGNQLGNAGHSQQPMPVPFMDGIRKAVGGGDHSLFLKSDGSLWVAGSDNFGSLGNGDAESPVIAPIKIMDEVTDIAAGPGFSIILKNDGTVWTAGNNSYGQLGTGMPGNQESFQQIASDGASIYAGGRHGLIITQTGDLLSFGYNWKGATGRGQNDTTNTPYKIAENVTAAAAGQDHSLFVKRDGSLWGAGSAYEGQLGLGPDVFQDQWEPVKLSDDVLNVGAGYYHSQFIKVDGSLWTMGNNDHGQLGIGSYRHYRTPVQVADKALRTDGGFHHTWFTRDANLPTLDGPAVATALSQGTAIRLATSVDSPTAASFRWQKLPLSGSEWQDVTSDRNHQGATSATLFVAQAAEVQSGEKFRVAVTNAAGTLSTLATVMESPRVVREPEDVTADAGSAVEFSLEAIGNPAPTYAWQLKLKDSEDWADLADSEFYGGTTSPRLTLLTPNETHQGASFRCIVRNGVNPHTVTREASLTVSLITRLEPTQIAVTAGSGTHTVSVQAEDTKNWSITNVPDWLAPSVQSGSGASEVNIARSENPYNQPRSSTIFIGGLAHRVDQEANTAPEAQPPPNPDPIAPPNMIHQPDDIVVRPGGTAQFIALTEEKADVTYQWYFNGEALIGATNQSLQIENVVVSQTGSYHVEVTNFIGTTTSEPALLSVDASATGQLVNLSSRAFAGSGVRQLVPGFVASGPVKLLVRAIGPTLAEFGVNNVIEDPYIRVTSLDNHVFETNDNWWESTSGESEQLSQISAANLETGAFPLGTHSQDAALIYEYEGGARTTGVTNATGESGTALIELYAMAGDTLTGRLYNISTRSYIPADTVFVLGFVLSGTEARTLLIRAVGPSLTSFGIDQALADPQLTIMRSGTPIIGNQDWGSSPSNENQVTNASLSAGAFELDYGSRDAALTVTLSPGIYTIVINGKPQQEGIVLAELYDLTEYR